MEGLAVLRDGTPGNAYSLSLQKQGYFIVADRTATGFFFDQKTDLIFDGGGRVFFFLRSDGIVEESPQGHNPVRRFGVLVRDGAGYRGLVKTQTPGEFPHLKWL